MLIKRNQLNEKGQMLYHNALTGVVGTLAHHYPKTQKSVRRSQREAIYTTPQRGAVNNNRKQTDGRKIKVFITTRERVVSFTTITKVDGKVKKTKGESIKVKVPSSKRIISVP